MLLLFPVPGAPSTKHAATVIAVSACGVVQERWYCRDVLDDWTKELAACAAEHEGSECLLLCTDHMQTVLAAMKASGRLAVAEGAIGVPVCAPPQPHVLSHVIVWCAA
jgi:hypothetical protein